MPKLKYVDLSNNKISKLDFNILNYPIINILYLYFNKNYFRQLDIANIIAQNSTVCQITYRDNKHPIIISNIGNFNPKNSKTYFCGNIDFCNVKLNVHPYMVLGNNPGELIKFSRCGMLKFRSSQYDCDCLAAEFFQLDYSEFNRVFGYILLIRLPAKIQNLNEVLTLKSFSITRVCSTSWCVTFKMDVQKLDNVSVYEHRNQSS